MRIHRARMIALPEIGAAVAAALASDKVSLPAGARMVERVAGGNVELDRVFLALGVPR